jgi:HlyD family secretion protein
MSVLRILKLKIFWIPFGVVVLIIVGVIYQRGQNAKPTYSTETVKKQDLMQTVSVTGTVEAAEEINLNFKTSGRISSLKAKVGDSVRAGDSLASLDSRDAESAVLTADANLKSARATLDKLKAGTQPESIAVTRAAFSAAQTTLDNARQSLENTKNSQTQAVSNALAQLVGLPVTVVSAKDNLSTITLTVSGTYSGTEMGKYTIRLDNPYNLLYLVTGLETGGAEGSRTTSTPIGIRGLKLQFSSTGTFVVGDTFTIEVPNTSSSSYASYKAAYDAALTTKKQQVDAAEATVKAAEQSLAQAQASLSLAEAPARSFDINVAEANVESAQATLIKMQSDFGDRILRAPVDGIVTKVNNEVGETNSLATPVVVMLSLGNREVKVKVPESDIAKLKVGQLTDMTLDAFGSAEHFSGHISFIDPASTVVQDVVYYEVTILFDGKDERIKPGMTTNIDITTGASTNVLVIPLRAVKYDADRKIYVETLVNDQVVKKEVSLGLKGDDGLVEITSGLQEGENVITFKQNGK